MRLTEEEKEELFDSITFLIELIQEFPNETNTVADSLGWNIAPFGDIPDVKLLKKIRKKIGKPSWED